MTGFDAAQGIRTMATFRSRLKQLMLERSARDGEPLTQKQLSDVSGVPIATVQRWYAGGFDRIDANTVSRLMTYFDCSMSDLIEVIEGPPDTPGAR